MSWNYRLVRYADGTGFGIHEVHYDREGKPIRMTAEPAKFIGESPEDVRSSILHANTDALRREVFDEPVAWARKETP